VTRNKLKEKNEEWMANFRRAHQREPDKADFEIIKE